MLRIRWSAQCSWRATATRAWRSCWRWKHVSKNGVTSASSWDCHVMRVWNSKINLKPWGGVSAPPFFACIKKFSPPKFFACRRKSTWNSEVFRLQKKNFGFLMSFSHGEEKTCVSFALLAVAQLFWNCNLLYIIYCKIIGSTQSVIFSWLYQCRVLH